MLAFQKTVKVLGGNDLLDVKELCFCLRGNTVLAKGSGPILEDELHHGCGVYPGQEGPRTLTAWPPW